MPWAELLCCRSKLLQGMIVLFIHVLLQDVPRYQPKHLINTSTTQCQSRGSWGSGPTELRSQNEPLAPSSDSLAGGYVRKGGVNCTYTVPTPKIVVVVDAILSAACGSRQVAPPSVLTSTTLSRAGS